MTTVNDYRDNSKFYYVPAGVGSQEVADLTAAIAEGEQKFADLFGVAPSEENVEAVKHYVFAYWLRWQSLRKTSAGASAKINFTQSQNHVDTERFVTAYNRACVIMGRTDLKLHRLFNL